MVKLLVSYGDLLKGISIVANALPPKTSLPSLTNILLETESDRLRLSATDLDTSVITSVPATISTQGSVALPGKKLLEIVKELPGGDIHIGGSGSRITISCGNSNFVLAGSSRETFPSLPSSSDIAFTELPLKAVSEAVRKTAFAVASDDYRPALNGALWKMGSSGLEMVATDGHRLARMRLGSVSSDKPLEAIVAPKALNLLGRLGEDETILLGSQGTQICFKSGETAVFSRIIEGPYPPYEKVIPSENPHVLTAGRMDLIAGLRRMRIIANPATHQVRFTLEPGKMILQAENTDAGEAREELQARFESDPLQIAFNGDFLMEILKNMDSESVILRIRDGATAVVIEELEQESGVDYLALLMPVRLANAV
jgi:DNA polymerase-3 subunit beta